VVSKKTDCFITLSLGSTRHPRGRKVIIHGTPWKHDKRKIKFVTQGSNPSPYVTHSHKSHTSLQVWTPFQCDIINGQPLTKTLTVDSLMDTFLTSRGKTWIMLVRVVSQV